MSQSNPRFPHTLTLTRVTAISQEGQPSSVVPAEDDPFGVQHEPTEVAEPSENAGVETIYEGECRSYRNVVTKTRDGVLVSDYVIAMPRADFAILPGDQVLVVANYRTMKGVVVDAQTNNLGTNIWWNQKEN